MNKKIIKPSEEILHQAKSCSNAWVYEIEGKYVFHQSVPSEAIKGAWKVDANGDIEGDFIPNPNYKPKNK